MTNRPCGSHTLGLSPKNKCIVMAPVECEIQQSFHCRDKNYTEKVSESNNESRVIIVHRPLVHSTQIMEDKTGPKPGKGFRSKTLRRWQHKQLTTPWYDRISLEANCSPNDPLRSDELSSLPMLQILCLSNLHLAWCRSLVMRSIRRSGGCIGGPALPSALYPYQSSQSEARMHLYSSIQLCMCLETCISRRSYHI